MIINTTINILGGLPDWNRAIRLLGKNRGEIGKRVEKLEYRQIKLQKTETAQAQAENYNPILDGSVSKNIAPLKKKGILKAEVLNAGQLTKYLNSDS